MTIASWNRLIFAIPLVAGNAQWTTNTTAADRAPSNWLDLTPEMPPNFPASGVIHRLWLGANSSKPMPPGGQLDVEMWVDPNGTAFNTARPIGSQSGNQSGVDWLGIKITEKNFFTRLFDFSTPVPFNYANGDKIGLEVASSIPIDWVWFNLVYEF